MIPVAVFAEFAPLITMTTSQSGIVLQGPPVHDTVQSEKEFWEWGGVRLLDKNFVSLNKTKFQKFWNMKYIGFCF